MRKLIIIGAILLMLTSCQDNISSISSGEKSSDINSMSISNQSVASTSTILSNSISISNQNTSNVDVGDSKYPIPSNINNKFEIGDMDNRTLLNTKSFEEVSEHLNFIYGNNIVKASSIDFYSENVGGGIKMHTNSKQTTYYGIQTHMFEDNWLKLEIDIHISTMENNSKKVINENVPVFTINAYNEQGKLVTTHYKDNFDTGMKNHDIRLYLSGVDVNYLEILNTNLPHKGSQSYNFGITGITLTGFPYAYEA